MQIQALCGDRHVVSMLVRFEPGAAVPDHDHAIDEDYLMLAGEMFLGDVLPALGPPMAVAPHQWLGANGGVALCFVAKLSPPHRRAAVSYGKIGNVLATEARHTLRLGHSVPTDRIARWAAPLGHASGTKHAPSPDQEICSPSALRAGAGGCRFAAGCLRWRWRWLG
ncbi:MAG: hypothetical protein QE285_12915 [Aquabacterium sp.]|nr:hypothetical protein [Aquabacterium sp.]